MQPLQADYFAAYRHLKLSRDDKGVLLAEFHNNGGPYVMNGQGHGVCRCPSQNWTRPSEQDRHPHGRGREFHRGCRMVIVRGDRRSGRLEQNSRRRHPDLENLANIRVAVTAAIEGRANVHSDYALLASVIVAAEGSTFQDMGHYAAGVVPNDGIFTTWSYRAGAGRAEAFLLNAQTITAAVAREWGVVAEVVPNGQALARAQALARQYLKAPEVTRRNTRIHFIQPLKERIMRKVGYGLSLERASSVDLAKLKQSKS